MNLFDLNNYISSEVFELLEKKIRENLNDADEMVKVVADMVRFNTLLSVARAGTGHLGASLSIMELLAEIYFRRFNISPENINDVNRDIFILSKGHAVPGLYALLAAKGFVQNEKLDKLRRWGGLQGHCDLSTHGIETNTGSLAIGLSRAVGFAMAKQRFAIAGKVVVITGDGELQEGQVWEALLSAASYKLSNFYMIIDKNQVQTDQFVSDIVKYGDLEKTLSAMGFEVYSGPAVIPSQIRNGFEVLDRNTDKPKVFIAETIKGQGVSYMEHKEVLKCESDRYIWHNKAPNSQELKRAHDKILSRNRDMLIKIGVECPTEAEVYVVPFEPSESGMLGEKLTPGFSEKLVELAGKYPLVAFDADLESDCGLSAFREHYPQRFFEIGIMEQHMISAAAAFSRLGYIPVINSYTAFLTSRSNEQIYNLATEYGRAIIVGHMSGVIPATPGKSHQAYRDISCMKNIHGIRMYQPLTAEDCKNVLERAVKGELGNQVYLRLSMAVSAKKLPTPERELQVGYPHVVKSGVHALIISAGPVLIGECIAATEQLEKRGLNIEIWNHPWLSEYDKEVVAELANRNIPIIVVEDHYIKGGLGESFYAAIAKAGVSLGKTSHLAIKSFTATGFRNEALEGFGLDRNSIVKAVEELL